MIALDDNGRVILTDEIPDIKQFIVREITEVHEFEELFHLRYRVYRDSRLASFCPTTDAEVDINVYDLTSRHLGLFVRESGVERLVGCCRGVTGELSPWHRQIRIAAVCEGTDLDTLTPPRYAFSCLDFLPDGDRIIEYYKTLQDQGHRVLEASKLCVSEDVRSLSISRFFLECVFSFFVIHSGYDTGVCYVAKSQRRFYEAYGFCAIPGIPTQRVPHTQLDLAPLHVVGGLFALQKIDRLELIAKTYSERGEIVFDSLPAAKRNMTTVAAAA